MRFKNTKNKGTGSTDRRANRQGSSLTEIQGQICSKFYCFFFVFFSLLLRFWCAVRCRKKGTMKGLVVVFSLVLQYGSGLTPLVSRISLNGSPLLSRRPL